MRHPFLCASATIGFVCEPRYHAPMDYRAFKKTLAHAGLSIREFADLLHMNKNSITNYAKNGEVPAHLGVIAQLVAALADQRADFRAALASVPARPKRSRGTSFAEAFGRPRKAQADHIDQVASLAIPAPSEKPRFWYPGDLVIPDTPVPGASTSVVHPAKVVKVTRRGRKILR